MDKAKFGMIVGDRLRYYLDERGLRHSDVADAVGIDRTVVTRWVRGRYSMSLYQAVLVARLLGVTVNDLIGGSDGMG